MNLYLIHCGYYDEEISNGIYEFHVNFPIAAETVDEAKRVVRTETAFQKKKMHIDGIQELKIIGGYQIQLTSTATKTETIINSHLHRDL